MCNFLAFPTYESFEKSISLFCQTVPNIEKNDNRYAGDKPNLDFNNDANVGSLNSNIRKLTSVFSC